MQKIKKCLLTKDPTSQRERDLLLALDASDHPIEIWCEDLSHPTYLGNQYLARVARVLPSIRGAFLSAGELRFFLPLSDVNKATIFSKKSSVNASLCEGDLLLVEVVKDAVATKDMVVTTNLSFPSKHLILTTGNSIKGISKKIRGEERKKIEEQFVNKIADNRFGLVVRTNASGIDCEELIAEYEALLNDTDTFLRESIHKMEGTCLKTAKHAFFEHIDHMMRAGLEEIVTDSAMWEERLNIELSQNAIEKSSPIIRRYDDPSYPLYKLYGVPTMLKKSIATRVYLPSGGNIVIEPTEALTVIDVNSGKNIREKKDTDFYLSLNLEAAAEIARQLRLRNLGGMILVDFINLKTEEARVELMQKMKQLLREDTMQAEVIDYTKLGLMEITRAKKYASLAQTLSYDCTQ